MDKAAYEKAVRLSRNFNSRSAEDTKELYGIIQRAVKLAQRGKEDNIGRNDREVKRAKAFLLEVYEPYIKKMAGKYFPSVETPLDFEDVIQEVYLIFLSLINKYDENISSFSYYINLMLPQYMSVWVHKINSTVYVPVDIKIVEATLCHPAFDSSVKVYDYLNGWILEKEFVSFIEERSMKSSRSETVKEVCDKIFLGNTTCSELATELGISYHAVYEIINKIKMELRHFFNENLFSEYTVTSTGDYGLFEDGYEFEYKYK